MCFKIIIHIVLKFPIARYLEPTQSKESYMLLYYINSIRTVKMVIISTANYLTPLEPYYRT